MKISSDRLEVIARQYAKTIADQMSAKEQYDELISYIKDAFKYPDNSSIDLDALVEDMYSSWERYHYPDKTFEEYLNTFDVTQDEMFVLCTYLAD